MKLDREQFIKTLLSEMQSFVPSPDTRSDISIQQTSNDSSEIQDVISHIRSCNGDIKWVEDGAMMAYTNNKVSLFQILDYLDDNDDVLDYEIQLMQTDLNGVNKDVTDEIDIDDVRDMNNFFFKILIFMDPEIVMFDPVYVDIDEVIDRNPYFDSENDTDNYFEYDNDRYDYVSEHLSHISEYVSWQGNMNETYILFEKKDGSKELHLIPPKTNDGNEYFDINKFNVDAAGDEHGTKKMFQDMGFTMTNQSKNKDIDYEMRGKPEDVIVYDIEKNNKDGSKIVVHEMLNFISEAVFYGDSKTLFEVRKKIKMNFKGKKRIKMQCHKGFKYVPERRVCVKITGSEMMDMKRSHIKARRTKKAAGTGYQKRINKKTKRAMRFRKQANIPNNKFM